MSSRARGRHDGRPAKIEPGTPEGDNIGASERTQGVPSPIPGGNKHVTNYPTVRQHVPIPDPRPEIRGVNAHGVPPAGETTHDRAEMIRGGPDDVKPVVPKFAKVPDKPIAVPVYLTENPAGKPLRSSSFHHFAVQASTGEPVRLAGIDPNRNRIGFINESTVSNIRIGQQYADLTNGGGALLPWPTNSYTWLETQDEVWGISADSGTPTISVIQEFYGAGGK